jgi:hypothetical protein
LRYGRDAVKKLLRERLLSGWILVTGDLSCIEDFKKKYYGEGSRDFEDHAILACIRDKGGLYVDFFYIYLAKKKKELEEILRGDLERAINIDFKKLNNECKAEVKYTSIFPKITINKLIDRVIKNIETITILKAKIARSQQPTT